ncbi:MAG TPA: cobyrinate a,c-diamide synthase [Solirubrobacterales bacterium]|nr:cobyrinate a,c-diamide synthase [Solirubrobacterales bacterium]
MSARVVIAGTASNVGKTTIASGLIAALRARGLAVQGFKVGPDYIDPGFHTLASGRPGRNLDAYLCGPELIAPLARHGSAGADVSVVEGVMGLFDGASQRGELASTAQVAKLLGAPVVLVLDASSMSRSVAAIVHGYREFDPELDLAGVVLNRVGSERHELLLREAIEPLGVPVLGCVRRDETLSVPERHLGLVPAGERAGESRAMLDALAAALERSVDVGEILRLARAAAPLSAAPWSPERAQPVPGRTRVAVAESAAFSFHYEENLELLRAAGAELISFDPLHDEGLPEGTSALLLAGGFPEVFAAELSANRPLREEIAAFARSGHPILAECGGLLYLCEELDGKPMCGVLPARGEMGRRLTLGYREATAVAAGPLCEPGEGLRGHEFHYSAVEPLPTPDAAAWKLAAGGAEWSEGFVRDGIHASYLHLHWAAFPQLAHRFVSAAARAGALTA